jgi:hypothetical protein
VGFLLQPSLEEILAFPHDRHQKVLFSNLGLIVFVKCLIDLVKQVLQSALRVGVGGEQLKG